ncbi:nuclear transport factor 2 family protein [Streptomyces parvulus]|uniref:Ethyl tert-butyl ether degradation protein EthD n=1 Tax=Streptomyces parvulus TaxID=146923 RepID=A0A369UY04_9ACTN|nr:nuclear transport factor 2 family protein [Streptomyces parvulus]RDD84628.1 ethyl tert-butyl ether degradation protein EthD [Streptomyces parvulus]
MTHSTGTVVDRYITLVDRAVHEPHLWEGLGSLFAAGATVRFGTREPVSGLRDIAEFYRGFYSGMADVAHVWNTAVLDDGTLQVRFIASWRTDAGELGSQGGTEYVSVDADGLIASLRVEEAGE